MPSIVAVADQLIAANLPALFLDTCILLDIIRAIKRRYPNCVQQAAQLLALATGSPAQCTIVVSHLVRHEWRTNERDLLDEAKRHLVEIQEQSEHFHDACDVLGLPRGFGRASYAGFGVADRMHHLSRQVLDSAIVIDPDDRCSGRAIHRVMFNTPPSKQGGEAKDCTILEECLAVCERLQAAAVPKKRVFCTSNTTDYCERSSHLHPNIASDFAAVGLRFTTNLPWAVHDITH